MLELKNICKSYKTNSVIVNALKDVSLNFRKNEFVSILGPSGSGKTTLLNIIGGLDSYDSGNLIICGRSTKNYSDKDWDNYRNNKIGFVFQNYNLIDHLTVLDNVKLSLTLSGLREEETKKKSINIIKKVGLINHINKKPNQLSGGQMQRVAIARALVNNPDIIVADEPTGALDKKTSEEILSVLKNISKEKLVIMVTHNVYLAKKYSDRIISIEDGEITNDTMPYEKVKVKDKECITKNKQMNIKSVFMLSLYNLLTKKKRTILTSVAGSIGIIGIALILSINKGVNNYLDDFEKSSISSYPIVIEKESYDVLGDISNSIRSSSKKKCSDGMVCVSNDEDTNIIKNNLKDFKNYIDNNNEIKNYTTNIISSYNVDLNIYNTQYEKVDSTLFTEIKPNNDSIILFGRMPTNYNELVVSIDDSNSVSKEISSILKLDNNKTYSYSEILNNSFKLILNTDYYVKENSVYHNYESNIDFVKNKIDNGIELKIVGIIKDVNSGSSYIGYDNNLILKLIEEISKTELYKEQIDNRISNLLNNTLFNNYDNTYEELVKKLGLYNINNPSSISIYAKDYKSKNSITKLIKKYNSNQSKENQIVYTDMMKSFIDGISKILNTISLVLIFVVCISLVVSSIMISIITYISVLERTKEIGILKAIGASKKDIKRIFISETAIEGFLSGLIGILATIFITFLANLIVSNLININNIVTFTFGYMILLMLISIIITIVSGLKPATIASKKNPVDSLRSE